MFIPIRTDKAPRTTPIMTQLLIIANVVVYLIGLLSHQRGIVDIREFTAQGQFDPLNVDLWNLISYQFLHDPSGLGHLGFNMLFLWVFGSAVEGRLKPLGFLAFYLFGGMVAGLGHMLFSDAPVIGASGSVSAVTGAYLALFPRSNVRVFVFFFIIGIVHIPSMWFIGVFFALDLYKAITGAGGVAYTAHLSGSLYGFAVGMTLLGVGILPRTDFDAFFLIKQWRRRSQFKSVAAEKHGGIWDAPGSGKKHAKRPPLKAPMPARRPQPADGNAKHRTELSRLIQQHDLAEAASRYGELLDKGIRVALPLDRQVDLANHLFAEGSYERAATAYETALQGRGERSKKTDVELMLGVVYGRHLNDSPKAVAFLESALPNLTDTSKKTLAQSILDEVRSP